MLGTTPPTPQVIY
jgi:DNA-binding CsgD family transcriptional regulator